MSRYYTRFAETTQTIGTTLAGWTLRGSATPTAVPAYGSPPVKRRYLDFRPTSTADHACATWDLIDSDADRDDFDLLMLVYLPAATATVHSLFARGAGTSPPTDYYRAKALYSGGNLTISIEKRVASAAVVSLASTALGAWSSSQSFWLRFRGNGTSLAATAWAVETDEPTSATVSATDSSLTAAGWVGVGGFGDGLICAPNIFSVGTNGDVAVTPRTNLERTTWLKDQSKEGIFLAELAFAKYDSSGSPYVGTGYWYISNGGYTSHPQDTPANQPYPALIARAPTIRRGIDLKLTGEAKMAFGEMRVHNPAVANLPIRYTAVDLNGSSQYAYAASSASLNFGTGSFSFMVRGRFDDYTFPKTFPSFGKPGATWNTTAGWGCGATYLASAIFVFFNDGTNHVQGNITIDAGYRPTDLIGKMCEIVLVVDRSANTARICVNGVLQSGSLSLTALTGSVSNSELLRVGYTVGWYHDGLLDEARAWSRALALSEVVAIHRRRPVDTTSGMVLLWPCNEGTGTSLADKSGNSNTGTLFGSPSWATGTYFRPEAANTPGAQDDILRMRWNRSTMLGLYGDRSWPKHDFFDILVGRLGMPAADSESEIRFPLSDLSDFLNGPVSTKFTSGDRAGQYKPKLVGIVYEGWIEPPVTDAATNTYSIADAAIDYFPASTVPGDENAVFVTDNGVFLSGNGTVASVDAGTETITTTADHGGLADAALFFNSGTPPAPLVVDTLYYIISAGLGTNTFRLSATRGGAAINLTATTAGATFLLYNYVLDKAAATVRLLAAPVGRVLVTGVKGSGHRVSEMYENVVYTSMGLSLNHKDAASFTSLYTDYSNHVGGLWLDSAYHTGREVLERIAAGTASWYGFTPDGLLQVGMMGLPAASAARSFGIGDVRMAAARQVDRIRAVDYSSGIQSYAPWFVTRGPMNVESGSWTQQQGEQMKSTLTAYSYGAAGIPLDDHPDRIDADKDGNLDMLMNSGTAAGLQRAHLVALHKSDLGVWELPMRRQAMECNLGETISIEHDRLGFKAYTTSDPPSPDNVAASDSRLCVVKDIVIDFDDASGFPIRVQVYRKIPGYYPTGNLN